MFYSVQESTGCDFVKIIHVDASISLISSINCILAYKTVLQAHGDLTAFMDLVQRVAIAVVFSSSLVADMGTPNAPRVQRGQKSWTPTTAL